ncbi:MAG TPA: cytochrome P450 [Solirubrobacteraceae bacterium]|nr:cytochrome P450 [Solirubrobacteraceae bacterium]
MRFPLGAALRLAELDRYDNAPLLHRLREREPVTWFAQHGAWLVTSRALFDELQMDDRRFSVDVADNPQRVVLGDQMLVADGQEHERHRRPFAGAFKYSSVHRLFAEPIAARVQSLLDGIAAAGRAELGAAFASPFAVGLAGEVLGLGLEQVREVHEIYGVFAEGMVGYRQPEARARAAGARSRLSALLAPGIERARARDDGSVLSAAIHRGAWRSAQELEANLRLILFGAVETVESMILNTTWALLRHPEQVRLLAKRPELWPAAVQEGLRFIPPVGYTDRWATVDTELGGVPIAAGDYVIGVIHAANRDPATVPDPDRFDITRDPRRQNLSFGKGIHMCLGVNLARLQGAAALRALFTRLEGLRLDPAHPTEPVGFNFRRPPHLHVIWDA